VSPNGQFIVAVDDTGISLTSPNATIQLTTGGIAIQSAAALTLQSANDVSVEAAAAVLIDAGALIRLRAAVIEQNFIQTE
jgi:uncharacterized protein (DUF2345 family)